MNWRTTAWGIVAGLGILFTQAGRVLDGDPNTALDMPTVLEGLGYIGAAIGVTFGLKAAADAKKPE